LSGKLSPINLSLFAAKARPATERRLGINRNLAYLACILKLQLNSD
jgi:hypothetical protein